jgi:hypothetical protein
MSDRSDADSHRSPKCLAHRRRGAPDGNLPIGHATEVLHARIPNSFQKLQTSTLRCAQPTAQSIARVNNQNQGDGEVTIRAIIRFDIESTDKPDIRT